MAADAASSLEMPGAEMAQLELEVKERQRRIAELRTLSQPLPAHQAVQTLAMKCILPVCQRGTHDNCSEQLVFQSSVTCRNFLGRLRSPVSAPTPTAPLVPAAEERGLSAGQFKQFFIRYCGMITELPGGKRPLCQPTKLAEQCLLLNRKHHHGIRAGRFSVVAPNLYAVNELFIKPHTASKRISYAELLNPEGKMIQFFLSHYWGEGFGEFTQGILRHALSSAQSLAMHPMEITYWCCAFSTNQHQSELGEVLEESPFFLALNSPACRGVVLHVDQMATVLTRAWCVCELYWTGQLRKPVVLSSPEGPLNDTRSSSQNDPKERLVAQISAILPHIDVQDADCSSADDKRKILAGIGFQHTTSQESPRGGDTSAMVKALVAEQIIFTLARMGDASAIEAALASGADVNAADVHGIRPLTYAAGLHGSDSEAAESLRRAGADLLAQQGAAEVLAMWDADAARRAEAIAAVRGLGLDFHAEALADAEESQREGDLGAVSLSQVQLEMPLTGRQGGSSPRWARSLSPGALPGLSPRGGRSPGKAPSECSKQSRQSKQSKLSRVTTKSMRYHAEFFGIFLCCMARPFFIVGQCLLVLGLWVASYYLSDTGKQSGLEALLPGLTKLQAYRDCDDLRPQVWRWWSYQFSHGDGLHLWVNLLGLLLGIPQERFQGSLRIAAIFNSGVIAGAGGHVLWDVHHSLVGMSGGFYAIIGLYLTDLLMNWTRKKYRVVESLVFALIITVAVLDMALLESGGGKVSHAAHVGGLLAGLFFGIAFGRLIEPTPGKRALQLASCSAGLMILTFCASWSALQWPPRTLSDPVPYCWHRAVNSWITFGDRSWHCVRCGDQDCIDRWSRERLVEAVSQRQCEEEFGGWAAEG